MLEERFGGLRVKVVVADGCGPYKTFFVFIQRDWVHVLRHAPDSLVHIADAATEAKEKDRPQAEAARDLAVCAHADLHALRAAAHQTALTPFTVHDLVLKAHRLAQMFDHEFELSCTTRCRTCLRSSGKNGCWTTRPSSRSPYATRWCGRGTSGTR